jgi:hypothetical protein
VSTRLSSFIASFPSQIFLGSLAGAVVISLLGWRAYSLSVARRAAAAAEAAAAEAEGLSDVAKARRLLKKAKKGGPSFGLRGWGTSSHHVKVAIIDEEDLDDEASNI